MRLLFVHFDVILVEQLLPLLVADGTSINCFLNGLRRLLHALLYAYVLDVLAAHFNRVERLLLAESRGRLDDLEEPLCVLRSLGDGIATVDLSRIEEGEYKFLGGVHALFVLHPVEHFLHHRAVGV